MIMKWNQEWKKTAQICEIIEEMHSFARGKRYFLDRIVSTSVFAYIGNICVCANNSVCERTAHSNVCSFVHDDIAERVVAFRA